MARVTHLRLERDHKARSLVWSGDVLVDLVGGGASVGLDGATTPRTVNWAYPFDRALVSPSGRFQVLYAALNTKGLVVATESSDTREIDRSYYHAHMYEYPVALGALSDGREVVVHCPDGYNRLAIEMLAGRERLSAATDKASDVFHSRLQLSPGGRYLLSAGWIWHPLGVAAVYDVQVALRDGRHLDGEGVLPWKAVDAEVEAACWMVPETLAVSTNPEEERLRGDGDGLAPGQLGVWSLSEQDWVARTAVERHTGTMCALGRDLLCLFEHPRLIDATTALVIEEWPEIATGNQSSSIIWHKNEPVPPIAVDSENRRFAVAHGDQVSVVEIDA